jgi:hypothetical protein
MQGMPRIAQRMWTSSQPEGFARGGTGGSQVTVTYSIGIKKVLIEGVLDEQPIIEWDKEALKQSADVAARSRCGSGERSSGIISCLLEELPKHIQR